MRATAAALALAALVAAPASAGRWEMDRAGNCREVWTARDLARGPIALVNGALRPLTAFVGGTWFAVAECHHSLRCLWVGPLWVAGSTAWGLGEGFYWAVTGLIDTPTLGATRASSYPASRFQLAPVVPFVESHPPAGDERCAS
jgi:hypothetical protein